ncbi:MAG TPA: hypothetical protein PLV92_28290, partial [Pirellulaceae bacterium]|nr:hypothetical protein [Pirellulaceae bacterium]
MASVADHVRVTLPAPTGIRCGFLDTGGVHVETADGWRRWGLSATTDDDATPISLRDVPLRFRSGIDAVLRGVDKNTYVFRGEECLNVDLGKIYPIAEEWGRLDNPVIERDSIDAVLHGRDGRIYVFSDDRFMSYRLDPQRPSVIPDYVDEGPAPILGRWGGVTNVRVAFIHDGVTYLVEHPDDEGRFRYVSYSTADYSRPDQDAPVTVDFSWWKLPPECVEAGFRRVDAAFVEGRNLFLFGERDFVQFDLIDRVWTHPKPIDRVWRGVPLQTTDFSTIRTVFQGPDRATYFFSDRKFVRYDPTTA